MTFLAMVTMLSGCGTASANCSNAIAGFEKIINSDVSTGNLNKAVHKRIAAELFRAQSDCIAGREAQASSALEGIKKRHGYR